MKDPFQKSVRDFMQKDVVSVQEDDSIKELFQLMDQNAILGAPVVNRDHHVVGIVTESDLIDHFTTLETPRGIHLLGSMVFLSDIGEFNQNLKEHTAETVKDLMNPKPITVDIDATLQDVIDLMSQNDINRLPVTENNKLVGIVTRSNVVHELAQLKTV